MEITAVNSKQQSPCKVLLPHKTIGSTVGDNVWQQGVIDQYSSSEKLPSIYIDQ